MLFAKYFKNSSRPFFSNVFPRVSFRRRSAQINFMTFLIKYLSELVVVPLLRSNRVLKPDFRVTKASYSHCRMSKTALMIIAQGSEEMEAIITVDMLRRGGVTVTLAGLDGQDPVLCSRNITVVPDKSLSDALADNPSYDAVILPGGLEGSERFCKSEVVGTLLREHESSGKIIAAICAAPTAFVAHGIAKGKRITSYPGTKEKITPDYTYIEGERVVVDGNVITSRGPGTAYWFGLSLIQALVGKEKADQVEKGMLISSY